MPFSASVVFFFTSSTSAKRFPLRSLFIRGNKEKSQGARSGEYGGCHAIFGKKIAAYSALCGQARCHDERTIHLFVTNRDVLSLNCYASFSKLPIIIILVDCLTLGYKL
jgi:hypothetical protein